MSDQQTSVPQLGTAHADWRTAVFRELGWSATPDTVTETGPETASDTATDTTPDTGQEAADAARTAALKTTLSTIAPDLSKLRTLDPARHEALLAAAAEIGALAKAGALDEALDRADALEIELAKAMPPSNVRFQKLRLRWEDAKKQAAGQLAALRAAILAEYEDPAATGAADRLGEILARFNEGLGDTLDDMMNAERGPTRSAHQAAAAGIVGNYMIFLATSPLVGHVEENPFVAADVAVTLGQPLALLEAELAKAGV